ATVRLEHRARLAAGDLRAARGRGHARAGEAHEALLRGAVDRAELAGEDHVVRVARDLPGRLRLTGEEPLGEGREEAAHLRSLEALVVEVEARELRVGRHEAVVRLREGRRVAVHARAVLGVATDVV